VLEIGESLLEKTQVVISFKVVLCDSGSKIMFAGIRAVRLHSAGLDVVVNAICTKAERANLTISKLQNIAKPLTRRIYAVSDV